MTCSMNERKPGVFRKPLIFSLLTAIVCAQGVAWALQEHEAETLQLNDKLTLSSLLSITLERHPQAGVLAARSATVDAETRYADRWLPDTTGLTAFHMSDRAFDDVGAYENEVALSFPMWLPGEKKAQTRFGEMLTTSQVSDEEEFRWRVSGQLRQQLWQLKLAVRQWELAVEQEQRLAQVLAQVTLFAEAGELSRADQLATMEELAICKGETMLLEAEYMDAIRTYRSFTGLETIPAQIDETLSEVESIGQDHPALRQALDHVAESSASTELIRERSNARPSVDVFWRGFRGDQRTPEVNALGLGFAMPLGKSPRRDPEVAKAFEEYASAQAGLLETRRALDLQLHEAEHVLHTTRERLENSETLMKAATERHQLDKLAFELGEFSTREWLRRLSRFREIERSHELLLIQQGAAIAAYNQAVGESL
jgi:cobalt-zinc-cadmium efflux system outer membrane protein